MDYILSKFFIILPIGICMLILVILNVLKYFTTIEFLDYLKENYPAKYYEVSMGKSYGLLAAIFHAGNPIEFPLFIFSSEYLRDDKVIEYKRKIRFQYLIGIAFLIGITIILIIS